MVRGGLTDWCEDSVEMYFESKDRTEHCATLCSRQRKSEVRTAAASLVWAGSPACSPAQLRFGIELFSIPLDTDLGQSAGVSRIISIFFRRSCKV